MDISLTFRVSGYQMWLSVTYLLKEIFFKIKEFRKKIIEHLLRFNWVRINSGKTCYPPTRTSPQGVETHQRPRKVPT